MARVVIAARSADRAVDATRQALGLLGGAHTVIVLLVVRPFPVVAPFSDGGGPGSGGFELGDEAESEDVLVSAAAAEVDARAELEEALAQLHLEMQARVRVESGEPGETFCRVATEERADLLVLGRRNRSLASRLRLGAVTHHVLEHAPCPVLVVHEQGD